MPLGDQVRAILQRLQAGDMDAHSVNENRTKDGGTIVCEWFNTPLTDGRGRHAGTVALAQDITERRRNEQDARRFQAIFEHALEPILLMDGNGRYVDANPAACAFLGYSREQLLGMTLWDVTPPELRPRIPELMKQFLSEGILSGQYTLVCKNGATRVAEFRSVANIVPGLHLGIHRDITERQRDADALRQSEARFRALAENVPSLVWTCTPERQCEYVNPQCMRYTGLPEEALLGAWRSDLIHPDDHAAVLAAWERGMRDGVPFEFDVRIRRHDGVWRWFEVRAVPLRDEHGRILRWFGTNSDIDDRKRAEVELRRLNTALENAVDGIALLDREGRYLSVNSAYARMADCRPEDLLGKNWQSTLHPDHLLQVKAAHQIMLQEGRAELEIQGVRQGQPPTWRQILMVKALDQDGRWSGHYCFTKDITERRRAQQALEQTVARLQDLSRRLVEVQEEERRHLACELHDEVGQILTGLRLMLRRAAGMGPDAMNSLLEEARGVLDQLLERVRGLSFDLRPAALDQLGLVPGLLTLFEAYENQTGIQVHFRHQGVESRFAPEVETAAYRTVQEALTNVARHAAVAGVAVRLWAAPETLSIQIEDRGRGLDSQAALTRSRAGGLAGMRERVSLLGGKFAIEARPGMGTRISATLPLGAAAR